MFESDTIMMIAAAALAGWVLWLLYKRHELRARLKLERAAALNRLIEKAGTSQEVVDFLKSETGNRLFDEPAPEAQSRTHLVRFIAGGVILALLGAAFLMSARLATANLGTNPDLNVIREVLEKKEWAILFLSLALSLWLVALIYHVMTRRRP
jgi:hypothetical protein